MSNNPFNQSNVEKFLKEEGVKGKTEASMDTTTGNVTITQDGNQIRAISTQQLEEFAAAKKVRE